jgi:hypothetical protein
MSSKNKSQLRTENSSNFPNNNSQFITPEKLRDFNNDVIDSMVVNQDTGSYLVTSSFDTGSREQTFTRLDGTTYINTIPGGNQDTGSLLITASVVDATITYTKGDGTTFTNTINNVVNATSSSHAEQADNATSSSNSISSSVVTDPNIAYINKDNTFSGTQNFDNISVSGTGSFGRINTVTGSAKVIGDAFVVVNADTPTLRYAGLQVYDSGSSNATASIQWDGLNDSWILVEEGGESSFILTGPTGSLGSEANLSNNSIPKAGVHRQLLDSNISDNGTTITLGSTTNVSGPLSASNLESIEITNLQNSGSEDRTRINGLSAETGSYARTDTANTFTGGKQLASGSNNVFTSQPEYPTTDAQKVLVNLNNQNAEVDGNGPYNIFQSTISHFTGYQRWYDGSLYNEALLSTYEGAEEIFNPGGWKAAVVASGSGYSRGAELYIQDDFDQTTSINANAQQINIGTTTGGLRRAREGVNIGSSVGAVNLNGNTTLNRNLILSASVLTDVETLTISSQTSSIDFNTAQTKVLTLVSGSDTHLTFTSQGAGQTVILKVIQPNTGPGTLTLESSTAKQPEGLHYSASQAADAIDILTLQTMENDGTVFVVSAKKFN